MPSLHELKQAILALESQRETLDNEVIETSVAALRQQIALLEDVIPQGSIGITFLSASIISNHDSTDTTSAGRMLSALYALQVRLKSVVTEQGGTLDPMSGYNVIARFSHENSQEAAEKAILAALEMLQVLQLQNHQIGKSSNIPFRLKVGIHSKNALPNDSASLNDPLDIEIAKALEASAASNGIVISHDTYKHIRSKVLVHHTRPVNVDGLDEALRAYQIARLKSPQSPRHKRNLTLNSSLIGRSNELQLLQSAFEQVFTERSVQVVSIIGEIGTGKTRLLEEYIKWLDNIPEAAWFFFSQAARNTRHQSYGLLRDMLANRFFIDRSDPLAEAQDKLIQGLLAQWGEVKQYQAQFIAHLIGFDFSHSSHLVGILHDAGQIRNRAFHYFADYLRVLVSQSDYPIILLLEDVHWADSGSLELVNYLAQECTDLPLLIIATAQPTLKEIHPQWGKQSAAFKYIELSPLSDPATHLLVAEILRNLPDIPRSFQEKLVQAAHGNALYIWEQIRLLIQMGVITGKPGQWHLDRSALNTLEPQADLAAIIKQRITHLSDTEWRVLQCAAVVGHVFWDRLIIDMASDPQNPPASISETLQLLEDQEFIEKRENSAFPDTYEYLFKNSLVCQLIYEQVPALQRQLYHARAAIWLIGRSMERIGQYAALIAEHYSRAGEIRRAIKWYTLAGTQAQNTFAPQIATYHFRQALNLIPDTAANTAERIPLLKGLGQALIAQARFNDAVQVLENVVHAAVDSQNPLEQVRALNQLATLHRSQKSNADYALHLAEEADALCQRLPDTPDSRIERCHAYLCQSQVWLSLGNRERAIQFAHAALESSQHLENKGLMAETLDLLGTIEANINNFDEASILFNKALKFCQENGDRWREATISNNLANLAYQRGDYQTALVMYQATENLAHEVGNRQSQLTAACSVVASWVGLGEYKTAQRRIQQLLPLIESQGFLELQVTSYCLLAETQAKLEQFDTAQASAHRALDLALSVALPVALSKAWRALGIVASQSQVPIHFEGQPYSIADCFEESLRIAVAAEIGTEQAATLYTWALHELATENGKFGALLWKQALDHYEKMGADYQVHRMQQSRPF